MLNSANIIYKKPFLTKLLIGASFVATMATPLSAQAAGSHYNCATSNGCELIKTKSRTYTYTQTKYPIVLAHGLSGWSRALGVVDYFYGIPQDLVKGGSQVFATKVSSFHNAEFRGEQLLRQIKTITAVTGKEKVNLIGHSLGGIDIRYVAGTAPEYVASVTAVASPEQGSKTADWLLENIAGGTAEDGLTADNLNAKSAVIMKLMNVFGMVLDVSSGIAIKDIQEQNAWEAANGLTAGYLTKFNKKFPAAMPTEYCGTPLDTKVDGIPYYSFMGTGQITNGFDFTDYMMAGTSKAFNGEPNDGLVSVCSSHLGYVLRDDYRMNHLDAVNQMLGITAWFETNPITVYRAQVNRLKRQEGL